MTEVIYVWPKRNPLEDKLSASAKKLLTRMRGGAWYPVTRSPPAAMQELADAGLIKTMDRVAVLKSCYVPVEADRGW